MRIRISSEMQPIMQIIYPIIVWIWVLQLISMFCYISYISYELLIIRLFFLFFLGSLLKNLFLAFFVKDIVLMLEQAKKSKIIHERLIGAAREHNLEQLKRLLKQGADARYIMFTDSNGWYSGNTHTALYTAVQSDFKGDQKNYVDVLQLLLDAGADPNFKATRGGWNHSSKYPLFSGVAYTINKFKDEQQKIRLIKIFVKHGININQHENHERSKNWRGYRTSTCFIFQMMDGCHMPSRIRELSRLCETFNFEQNSAEIDKELREEFEKQFPEYKSVNPLQIHQEEEEHQMIQLKSVKEKPQVSFIEALINLGINPNSSRSQSYWENNRTQMQRFAIQTDDYQDTSKFDKKIKKQFETVLHRAIMNDIPHLIKLLLQKGAQVEKKCRITLRVPIFPNDWPQSIKQRKKKQNARNLNSYQNTKHQLLQKLKTLTDQQQKTKTKASLQHYQFLIFRAKRFTIEGQLPHPTNQVIELSCLEIAEKLSACEETIALVRQAEGRGVLGEKKL